MTYVDGFVSAVPTANKEAFLEHAQKAAEVCRRHGALQVIDAWGDDIPDGKLTSFPLAVQCQADETVVLSWIIWPSKAARETGMAAIMADPDMSPEANPMPFDGQRLIYGSFEVISDV